MHCVHVDVGVWIKLPMVKSFDMLTPVQSQLCHDLVSKYVMRC